MSRTRTGFFSILAMVLPLGPLSAQQPPSLAPGQRVRVTAPAAGLVRKVGTLGVVTADSLVLLVLRPGVSTGAASVDTVRKSVPRTGVQTLEVSRGGAGRGWLHGAELGFLLGAGVGFFIPHTGGKFLEKPTAPPADDFLADLVFGGGGAGGFGGGILHERLIFALLGGVAGGTLGAIIGHGTDTERWERVPLDRLRVGMTPLPAGRLGLGASLAF